MDLSNVGDFSKDEHHLAPCSEEEPDCIIGSTPCTMFRLLLELTKAVKGNAKEWLEKGSSVAACCTGLTQIACLEQDALLGLTRRAGISI